MTGASVIVPLPLAVTLEASIGPVMTLVHEYVVPPIVDVGVNASAVPLQTCCEYEDAEFVRTGTGLTVAVTTRTGPGHPFADGVMVYVTVPLLIPSVLVNSCDILFPDPLEAPVTFDETAVHVKVVPATAFEFMMSIAVDSPEQIVWLAAVASGTALTVTTRLTGVPLQLPTPGVIV